MIGVFEISNESMTQGGLALNLDMDCNTNIREFIFKKQVKFSAAGTDYSTVEPMPGSANV